MSKNLVQMELSNEIASYPFIYVMGEVRLLFSKIVG